MTNILTMRTFLSAALLAIVTLGTACSEDDIAHEAAEKAEQLGVQAEDAILQRSRALADDTREGAAAQAEADQRAAAIGQRMGSALNEEARELTGGVRSGRDALAAETALVAEAVKQEARKLEKNVEHSAKTYDESYNAARKSGENVIEAGGEAYNSVVEIPNERTRD